MVPVDVDGQICHGTNLVCKCFSRIIPHTKSPTNNVLHFLKNRVLVVANINVLDNK